MHVYAFPSSGSELVQWNDTTFRLGDFKYIADVNGDTVHSLGSVTNFPGYCSKDALLAIIRAAIKTAANSTYSVTLTDDQLTVLGL